MEICFIDYQISLHQSEQQILIWLLLTSINLLECGASFSKKYSTQNLQSPFNIFNQFTVHSP